MTQFIEPIYPMQNAWKIYWEQFKIQYPIATSDLDQNSLLLAAFQNVFFEGYKAAELNSDNSFPEESVNPTVMVGIS
jgi:hypothetical protein